MRSYYVYILASKRNGTLYIGVTNDLWRRVAEHKTKVIKGFTEKYSVNMLVYYEEYPGINEAIKREKQLKKWNRAWKIRLIEEQNSEWKNLCETTTGFPIKSGMTFDVKTGFPPPRE